MKASIIVSVLILLAGIALRVTDQKRLADARESHARLVNEASSMGISIDTANPDSLALATKRKREDTEREAKQVAKEMIAFALEMQELQKSDADPDAPDIQKRTADFMDQMFSLSTSQLKTVIQEFRDSSEMNDEMRLGMVMFAIMTMAEDHPEAALAIFTEASDMPGSEMMNNHILSSSLASWAEQDPLAAVAWVRENGEKYPDLVTDEVKAGLVSGAAKNDMAAAFGLITELDMEKPGNALRQIGSNTKTAMERTKFLNLLRDFGGGKDDGETKKHMAAAMASLNRGIAKDGFEAGSKWISENNLSQQELKNLTQSIVYSADSAEKGQWLSWMGENITGKGASRDIQNAVSNWTNNDYSAAGEWLAAEPDGPTKTASIIGYAQALSRYEPEAAADWALTIPTEKSRTKTLETIYRNWPTKTDEQKAAKQAFGEKYSFAK
ncbi:MAG: hypothetical protein ACSHX7_06095 [Luteolibacter sp.]